jgi:vitamin B12/bleomycin/antimicrobial peptide transport system ATP-binding/permease protein
MKARAWRANASDSKAKPGAAGAADTGKAAPPGGAGVGLLLTGWWRDSHGAAFIGWSLLALLVALALGEVWAQYLVSDWQKLLFDAFQKLEAAAFREQLIAGLFVITVYIACGALKQYVQQAIAIRWRRWMTEHTLRRWLERGPQGTALYALERSGALDNPDQRIADDIRIFVELTLEFGIGLLFTTVLFFSFAAVLWQASGPFEFTLFGSAWQLQGHLFWVALAYVIVGNAVVHAVGHKLIPTNERQQAFEADFRFALTRARENAEAVALADGAAGEQQRMHSRFASVASNWMRLARLKLGLVATAGWYEQFSTLLAFAVCAPRLFAGTMTLGEMMQAVTAFGVVRQALSWFITNYARIADWKASANRLVELEARLQALEAPAAATAPHIQHLISAAPSLAVHSLTLARPAGGGALTLPFDWAAAPGERWLVSGPSGLGKTTLLRAVAGIWPDGQGQVLRPQGARVMLLPQRAYFPLGSLREALAYPLNSAQFDDAAMREVLHDAGLPALAEELDGDARWANRLSPGELQRLGFARVWLQRPDVLFLDEATSALDEAHESHVYQRLLERLPAAAIVSVAHRATVARFHNRHLRFEAQSAGVAWVREMAFVAVPTTLADTSA